MRTPRNKPLIFVVDDDAEVLRAMRIALSGRFQVEISHDPEDAIEAIRDADPDVIVLDIRMPEHDGFWVFHQVRKFNEDVPIVFNSAYQDTMPDEDASNAFAPFSYLPKNGNFTQFVRTIEEAARVPRR